MRNPILVGDRFRAQVDGTVFEVVECHATIERVGAFPYYVLAYNNGKTAHASESNMRWMLKFGGFVRLNRGEAAP